MPGFQGPAAPLRRPIFQVSIPIVPCVRAADVRGWTTPQNAMNRTVVAPYSVRSSRDAAVATPIRWDELDDSALRPDRWTIASVGARLAAVGDAWAGMLELKQELPALD